MTDEEILQSLQARKRAAKFKIREEQIHSRQVEREQRKRERIARLQSEVLDLEEAARYQHSIR